MVPRSWSHYEDDLLSFVALLGLDGDPKRPYARVFKKAQRGVGRIGLVMPDQIGRTLSQMIVAWRVMVWPDTLVALAMPRHNAERWMREFSAMLANSKDCLRDTWIFTRDHLAACRTDDSNRWHICHSDPGALEVDSSRLTGRPIVVITEAENLSAAHAESIGLVVGEEGLWISLLAKARKHLPSEYREVDSGDND